jgi:acyl dehydratase
VPLYLEDFAPGQVRESPPRTLSKDEIIAFARDYDPQPFHTDEQAAKHTVYGGLIASGWQTTAIMMRLLWDTFLKDTSSLGSPGSDEIRWLKPVRPGDTLRARFTIVDVTPSRSKPDRGIVRTFTEMLNQHGETVMTHKGMGMFGRRPRDMGGPEMAPPYPPAFGVPAKP